LGTSLSQFIVIATSTYKKDQWKITINGLSSKPCSDFIKIFKHYAMKIMDREAVKQN
jgi:hypothetical protein